MTMTNGIVQELAAIEAQDSKGNPWFDVHGRLQHADIARRLITDLAFAHDWLCHANGSKCADGCDVGADTKRVAAYSCIPCATLELTGI
jgi:hypothetical protein